MMWPSGGLASDLAWATRGEPLVQVGRTRAEVVMYSVVMGKSPEGLPLSAIKSLPLVGAATRS